MISQEEYDKLVFLARLDPKDPVLSHAREEFQTLIDYVNQLQELDLRLEEQSTEKENGNLEKSMRNTKEKPLYCKQREDIPKKSLSNAQIAGLAPKWEAGHFAVPRILSSES